MSAASLRLSSRRCYRLRRRRGRSRGPQRRRRCIYKPRALCWQIHSRRCPRQLSSRPCQHLTRVPGSMTLAQTLQGGLVMSQRQRLPPRPMQLLSLQSPVLRSLLQSVQTPTQQRQPGNDTWPGNGKGLATLHQSLEWEAERERQRC